MCKVFVKTICFVRQQPYRMDLFMCENKIVLLVNNVLALDLEGVHDVKLHHPSSSVATSNQ